MRIGHENGKVIALNSVLLHFDSELLLSIRPTAVYPFADLFIYYLRPATQSTTQILELSQAVPDGDGLGGTELIGSKDDSPSSSGTSWLRTLASPEFSIALGGSILLAVLTNRLATAELLDSQARTDILGVIASGGLITNGVYQLVSRVHFMTQFGLKVVVGTVSLKLDEVRVGSHAVFRFSGI